MLTLNSESPPESVSAVTCVVCAVRESCQSVLVCVSVSVTLFICTDGGVVEVLLLTACMLDCSYTSISNIFYIFSVNGKYKECRVWLIDIVHQFVFYFKWRINA